MSCRQSFQIEMLDSAQGILCYRIALQRRLIFGQLQPVETGLGGREDIFGLMGQQNFKVRRRGAPERGMRV